MLRTLLVASPFVIVSVISCGDSSSSFDDITGGAAGTMSSTSGASTGGDQSQGGTSSTAGKNGGGGTNNAGGKNGTAGNGTAGNNGTAGTTNQNLGGAAGAGSDLAGAGPGGAGAPSGVAGAAGSPAGPQCPDVFGTYDIKSRDGTCGTLNNNAPQSIEGTDVACFAHFVSAPAVGAKGVNGGAALDATGNFKGATLYLDSTQRSPCSGMWNEGNARMTLKCGGPGDMCTVVLERQ